MIFPEKPVLWINPQKITHHALPPGAQGIKRLHRRGPLVRALTAPAYALWRKQIVFGGAWDMDCDPVDDMRVVRWMRDLARWGTDYRQSEWYTRACAALDRNGVFRHKSFRVRDEAGIAHLFETEFLPLLTSMRQSGYQAGLADLPLGLIDRSGQVLKSEKGRHRFAAALATGVTRFPLRIAAVHAHWAGSDRGTTLSRRITELAEDLT